MKKKKQKQKNTIYIYIYKSWFHFMLTMNNFCKCFLLCFVVFLGITLYVLCISKFAMILLSVNKDTSLIIGNDIFVIYW